ncbi:hypothetical protein TRFO_17548 [Tritrichomonas foetus]|uniref:Right handed beta helix domain-containing protein n=1 Tax=Tritrichomonas foetus TaxID=1144522 RepID=A0A1J4KMQ6_9EUKA|nr:hypothetical protein TRFO_17548 [Tritrichomonas foetus]|eukprot:OHT12515.1 hypothetical protein TRFO_17548 [Tritrichomonas foetus]
MLNSTLLYKLTLTSFISNSPLLSLATSSSRTNHYFKSLQLSHFSNTAFYLTNLQSATFKDSQFSSFLNSPIVVNGNCTELHDIDLPFHLDFQGTCMNILNTIFRNVHGEEGGALSYISNTIDMTIDRSQFLNCNALQGGALYIKDTNSIPLSTNKIIVTYCHFENCFTDNPNTSYGGAIYCRAHTANFRNNNFTNVYITKDGYGGAIYAEVAEITNKLFFASFNTCSVKGNTSFGGAVYINLTTAGLVNMSYMSFSNCYAVNGSCVYLTKVANLEVNHVQFSSINGEYISISDSANATCHFGTLVFHTFYTTAAQNFFQSDQPSITYISSIADKGMLYMQTSTTLLFNPNFMYSQYFVLNGSIYPGYPVPIPPNASIDLDDYLISVMTPPPSQTATPAATALPTRTPVATPRATASRTPAQTPVATPSPSVSPNITAAATLAATPVATKAPLGTIPIVFITIACVIVTIGIVVAIILLCKRGGGCNFQFRRNPLETVTVNSATKTYF